MGLPRELREVIRDIEVLEQQVILRILKGRHPKTPSSGYIPVAHSSGTEWKSIGQVGKEKREAHPPHSIRLESQPFQDSVENIALHLFYLYKEKRKVLPFPFLLVITPLSLQSCNEDI